MGKRPRRGYLPRNVNTREIRETFLIVCEGVQTEPNYFRSFRVLTATVEVYGCGANTRSLVDIAIRLSQQVDYDQVWCVFDRDSFPAHNFNQALILAKQHNIKVAYSNEAFELWYLLHFNYHDAALCRSDYSGKLTDCLNSKYRKNGKNMYELLLPFQENAIRNAKALLAQYNQPNPLINNPSTTVHMLVEELNRFIS
jgi:hypothetical protein